MAQLKIVSIVYLVWLLVALSPEAIAELDDNTTSLPTSVPVIAVTEQQSSDTLTTQQTNNPGALDDNTASLPTSVPVIAVTEQQSSDTLTLTTKQTNNPGAFDEKKYTIIFFIPSAIGIGVFYWICSWGGYWLLASSVFAWCARSRVLNLLKDRDGVTQVDAVVTAKTIGTNSEGGPSMYGVVTYKFTGTHPSHGTFRLSYTNYMIKRNLYDPLEVGVSTIPVRYENANPAHHVVVGDIGKPSLAERKKDPSMYTLLGSAIILGFLVIPGFWMFSADTPNNFTIAICLVTLALMALAVGMGCLCAYCNGGKDKTPTYGEEEDSSAHVIKDVEMGESLPPALADRGVAADDGLPVAVRNPGPNTNLPVADRGVAADDGLPVAVRNPDPNTNLPVADRGVAADDGLPVAVRNPGPNTNLPVADRGVAADDGPNTNLPVAVREAVLPTPGESVESAVMVAMDEDPSSPVMVADTIVMLPSGIEVVQTHSS